MKIILKVFNGIKGGKCQKRRYLFQDEDAGLV